MRLWKWVVLVTGLVSITPLVILTFINYSQYQQALKTEITNRVQRMTSLTKRSIEFFLDERRATLTLIAKNKSYEDLSRQEELAKVYHSVKNVLGGIVDLGIIDSNGKQIAYVGPYELAGKDYSEQAWFHEVTIRGHYISEVFMGYRNLPHFVIAVAGEKMNGKSYVLRATIDSGTLVEQIRPLNIEPPSEAFIIDRKGILQTPSRNYGEIMEKALIAVPSYSESTEIIERRSERGPHLLESYVYIKDSPFILIILKHLPSSMESWFALRRHLWAFLLGSIAVILFIVMGSSWIMVTRIREADRQRAQVLHNIEYTNKMASIGRLSAGVAHEINNPLAIIGEKAGMAKDIINLSEDFPQKDKMGGLLDSILNSVDRCVKITQRLLGFAKHIDVNMENIDLDRVVEEVISFLEQEARYRNISIEMEKSDEIPTIVSDRGQLQQVFLNIMNNSLNALSEEGKEGWIKVYIKQEDVHRVSVTISDNGPGIGREHLKHIFEPFYTTRSKGTGLGLSITYGIIEKLGGTIDVESEPGKGTSFTVTLPVNAA